MPGGGAAMGLVSGKKALVLGVANERSLAYAIALKLVAEGAQLVVAYQGPSFKERVQRLAESLGKPLLLPCDVTHDADIDRLFERIGNDWGGLDMLVHAIAYADKDDLVGPYYKVSRAGFLKALEIGAYSLTAVTRAAVPLMETRGGGSLVTLTYFGAEKVILHYNIMGITKAALEASVRYLASDLGPKNIRVNAISAGPIKTLSAKGVSDFNTMLAHARKKAPLQRNVESEEVGNAGLFLLSDLSQGITGEVMHVDCGYNIIGM
jgi:enoyl-[acyl-carrier protein] reductase I